MKTGRPAESLVLDELLKSYRADVAPERFVCLVDDLEAMRVAALWPSLPKGWRRPRTQMPVDVNERWIWIWDGCDFDEYQLASMVELPLRTLRSKITMLASARILFPDGTVAPGARVLLHGRVKREVQRLMPAERTKPEKGTERR